MSTKTSIKRIALVAVSALGFGVLGSVAPASAAEAPGLTTAINGAALAANTNAINTSVELAVGMTTTAVNGNAATDTITLSAKVTSFPIGGAVNMTAAAAAAAATDGDANMLGTMTYVNTAPYTSCIQTATGGTGNTLAATTTAVGTTGSVAGFCKLAFTPTVVGTYIVTVWRDYANVGAINDNEVSQTFSFTITSAGAVAANQLAKSDSTTAGADGSTAGHRISSVGVEVVQSSGRTGIQVGFAPQYIVTRNAGATVGNAGQSLAALYGRIAYTVTNPAGTAVTVVSAQGGTTASTSQDIAGGTGPVAAATAAAQTVSPTTGWPQKGSAVYFSAATAGKYTITAWHDANLDGLVSVGEATTTSTVEVAADALPSITFTTYGQSLDTDAAAGGNKAHLVKISLKNGTLPASLGLSEVLTITGPTGTIIDDRSARNANFKLAMGDAGDGVSVALTQSNFDGLGNAYINVGNSTAGGGTYALTAVVTGGTGAGASGSGSFTVLSSTLYPNTAFPDKALTFTNLTGVAGTGRTADDAATAYALTVKTATATTVSIGAKPGAAITAKGYAASVVDNYGLITGLVAGTYNLYKVVGTTATTADSVVAWSVAVPALASTVSGNAVSLVIPVIDTSATATVDATFNIAQAAAAATTSYSNPTFDAATYTYRAAVGSANKLTVEVVDQFGNALPNISVNAAIAGRNATTVIPTMLTDANGFVSYTLTDASTSTTSLTDTITFTPAAGLTSNIIINYATYLPAAKITMVTPDSATATATGIAGTVKSDIDASSLGAQNTTATVSITVTDANGATLPAGVPVTFSIKGDNAAILSTKVTTVLDAAGKASTSVYAWKNVNATVTATVGSVTASGIVYFQQADCTAGQACAEARTVATTVKDGTVTAKVTDRFGNPIKGVTLSASRVGTGTFAGASSTTGTTNAAGEVDFVLTGGTAKVTVAFATTTFGQSHATKGYVDAGITAIVASAAGTTFLAEDGVGASFDAAGVNSVTVDVTAVDNAQVAADAAADAAAEAIDAANAATDAANLAAEAADAATVAAEEARDAADAATAAVEELATQVATLMAALKAQITTLANTVAKIAKKVKA